MAVRDPRDLRGVPEPHPTGQPSSRVTRQPILARRLGTALAVSALLALGACSSDDGADPMDVEDTGEVGDSVLGIALDTDPEVPPVVVPVPDATGRGTLDVDTGETSAVPLSPGAFIVPRESDDPLLQPLSDANPGLEGVAEDGDPAPYVAVGTAVPGATVFDTPVDADEPGPIGPGGADEFTFGAVPGDKLGFVTMFIPSNDWFYTPTDEDNSIELFGEDGSPSEQ